MPNLLALDCSDRACSVALAAGGEITEIYLDEQRVHARRLLGLISECLEQQNLRKEDLNAVVWARGPGSFTGLRIAAACVQGLCFGLGIPSIGVSSLLAMAQRSPKSPSGIPQKIWVGIDARMGEIYTAGYLASGGEAEISQIDDECLISADQLQLPDGYDVYLGSALSLLRTDQGAGYFDADCQIHAGDLLNLPEHQLQSGVSGIANQIEPVYLRNADAWKKMESS